MRDWLLPVTVFGVLAVPAAVLVRWTLDAPELPTFEITPPTAAAAPADGPDDPGDPGDPDDPGAAGGLVGPRVYTLDASDSEHWVFFDFSAGSVVPFSRGGPWDLAFRRFDVIANGGQGFAGAAGVMDLGDVPFASVTEAPAAGYVATEAARDSANAAVGRWYDYSFTSHLLSPKPRVYAVRTADGRYAKLRFLSYYCPGPTPGCITFEYVYQGSGARNLHAP